MKKKLIDAIFILISMGPLLLLLPKNQSFWVYGLVYLISIVMLIIKNITHDIMFKISDNDMVLIKDGKVFLFFILDALIYFALYFVFVILVKGNSTGLFLSTFVILHQFVQRNTSYSCLTAFLFKSKKRFPSLWGKIGTYVENYISILPILALLFFAKNKETIQLSDLSIDWIITILWILPILNNVFALLGQNHRSLIDHFFNINWIQNPKE